MLEKYIFFLYAHESILGNAKYRFFLPHFYFLLFLLILGEVTNNQEELTLEMHQIKFENCKLISPQLSEPDRSVFPNGVYRCDVALPLSKAELKIKEIGEVAKQHHRAISPLALSKLWQRREKFIQEKEDQVTFKLRALNYTRLDRSIVDCCPKFISSDCKKILSEAPGHESLCNVAAQLLCYTTGDFKGLALIPVGIQVLKFVSHTPANDFATEFGFSPQKIPN